MVHTQALTTWKHINFEEFGFLVHRCVEWHFDKNISVDPAFRSLNAFPTRCGELDFYLKKLIFIG